MGEGLDADVTRQTRLLGESRLPYLWGPMAGAALFGRQVMWHVGTVIALHDETATARTITLEVPDWPGHVAGQHVDVRLTALDGYSGPYLRIHTSCSEGLAAAGRPDRRRSDREHHLAIKACPDLLPLRPHTVRRKCVEAPYRFRQ